MNSFLPSSSQPLTPTSSRRPSSSIKQKVRPAPYHLRPESDSQAQFPKTRPSVIKAQQHSPLYSLPSPSHQPPFLRAQEFSLQRTSSLPAYPPTSLPTASSAPPLEVPFFGQSSSKSESSPLVFSPNYISSFLNKFDDDSHLASSSSTSRCSEQHQLLTPHPVCEGRPGLQRCQSESLVHGRRPHLPRPIIVAQPPVGQYTISVTPVSGSHPAPSTIVDHHHDVFASARTTLLGTGSAYGIAVHAPEEDKDFVTGSSSKAHVIRLLEEKHKQKYAIELIEQALATVNRIWPETIELSQPLPEKKQTPVLTASAPISPITPSFATHIRSQVLQQATPDSSPASSSKKRKRILPSASSSQTDTEQQSHKKRAAYQPGAESNPTAVPIHAEVAESANEPRPSPPSSSSPITLRLFVRELLRRSKTHCSTLEVALCYLDGVEETVKRLKDCYKLGMAFGTVAMAEKGVYEEGMKDEKRIMSLAEVAAESAEMIGYLDHPCQDDAMTSWTPISPESDNEESKGNLATPKKHGDSPTSSISSPAASLNILASHPLLDPRRSFLAALVIATKFLQDRAYSNKAWAKLSGLPAQEIGRCERALGGALGWRVWVGKDFGKIPSSPRVSSSPVHRPSEAIEEVGAGGMEVGSTEEGTNSEDVVHGLNDPIAESFIAAAATAQAHAAAKATVNVCAPSNVATASAAAAGVWSRAMSWPCFAPSSSASASSSAPSSATWVSDDYLHVGEESSTSREPLPLAKSTSASHFIEPSSLAASLQIINSMLDEAEAKQRSAAPRLPSEISEKAALASRSGSISATPSTPETIIVPGDHHLPQPITAGKTPVMPMCGAFLHCTSPLQMETGMPPYPFSFVASLPSSQSTCHSQALSPSPTLLHPGYLPQTLKLSPFGSGTIGSGGSCSSTSFLSPDEIDTPPQHVAMSHSRGQVKVAVDRQATLVEHQMEFSLDGLTGFPSDSYVKPPRYLPQPQPHHLQDRRQYFKSANRLYENAPIMIPHIPPASVAF